MRLQITGAQLVLPGEGRVENSDLFIDEGLIVAIGAAPDGFVAERRIDAPGCWLLPGLVDCQARLRDPGQPEKANIESETAAAIRNGITSICLAPDTVPPIDNSATVELIHHRSEMFGDRARLYPIGALTRGLKGQLLANMASLLDDGCIAFSNAREPIANNLVQRRAMDYAAGLQTLVIIQPIDHDLHGNGCAHEGKVATRLGLPGIAEAAETAALAKDIELVAQTGARTHFGQLSCARSVEMIRNAKAAGLPISADCAIHQLFLTEHDLIDFDSNMHLLPPLRSEADRDALRRGIADGTIDCLCSDHQPHEIDVKLKPFPSSEPGISALDTFLALAIRLHNEGLLGLPELMARVSLNPACIMGLPCGDIGVGRPADLVLVDPDAHWTCNARDFVSKGHNTPFTGWDFQGVVTHTIIGGEVVYEAD